MAKGTGTYATGNCTTLGGTASFDWVPGPGPNPKFTLTVKAEEKHPYLLQGINGTRMGCNEATATGEITGPQTVGNFSEFTWNGCVTAGVGCEHEQIHAEVGEGLLGVWKTGETPVKDRIGIELTPLHIKCTFTGGAVKMSGEGAVIGQVSAPGAMSLTKILTLAGKKVKGTYHEQVPSKFVGEPAVSMEWGFGGFPEPLVIVWRSTIAFAEKMEINPVV